MSNDIENGKIFTKKKKTKIYASILTGKTKLPLWFCINLRLPTAGVKPIGLSPADSPSFMLVASISNKQKKQDKKNLAWNIEKTILNFSKNEWLNAIGERETVTWCVSLIWNAEHFSFQEIYSNIKPQFNRKCVWSEEFHFMVAFMRSQVLFAWH